MPIDISQFKKRFQELQSKYEQRKAEIARFTRPVVENVQQGIQNIAQIGQNIGDTVSRTGENIAGEFEKVGQGIANTYAKPFVEKAQRFANAGSKGVIPFAKEIFVGKNVEEKAKAFAESSSIVDFANEIAKPIYKPAASIAKGVVTAPARYALGLTYEVAKRIVGKENVVEQKVDIPVVGEIKAPQVGIEEKMSTGFPRWFAIGLQLGEDAIDFALLVGGIKAIKGVKKTKELSTKTIPTTELEKYQRILGVNNKASLEEITAKRNAILQATHPDKIMAVGGTAEDVKIANQFTSGINEAYNKLSKVAKTSGVPYKTPKIELDLSPRLVQSKLDDFATKIERLNTGKSSLHVGEYSDPLAQKISKIDPYHVATPQVLEQKIIKTIGNSLTGEKLTEAKGLLQGSIDDIKNLMKAGVQGVIVPEEVATSQIPNTGVVGTLFKATETIFKTNKGKAAAQAVEARKYKSAKDFVKAQTKSNSWSEAQKTNPDLWNKGILRKDIEPYGAKGVIPKEVHSAQGKWQNYGEFDEISADKVYKRTDSGSFKGEYEDKFGNAIRDNNGNVLQDVYDDATGEWIKPMVSNKELRNELLDTFATEEGKQYLNEVINALPKNPDGTITAYRIGKIGGGEVQSYTLSEGMAKTFSNQGTSVLPDGTPGLPAKGYKDFGALPANMVKIDTKGIKAWSPYDAEILVEPKYVQTKSQLTDLWTQSQKPKGKLLIK